MWLNQFHLTEQTEPGGGQKEISEPSPCAPTFRDISKTGTTNVPTVYFFWKQPLTPFLERVNRLTATA